MEELGDVLTSCELGSRRSLLTRLVRQGHYIRAYPGVYVRATRRHDPFTRLVAAAAVNPSGYFVGAEVFALFFDGDLRAEPLTMTGPSSRAASTLRVIRSELPPDWRHVRRGFQVADPAVAAAFLAGRDGGAGIDRYLRSGGRISIVREALPVVARWGNHQQRCRVVAASRAEPWSSLEREYHEILWGGAVRGWVANFRVKANGRTYYLDIAFVRERVALEIDGFEVHSRRHVFEADRTRQNDLVLAGWLILRFTARDLADPPAVLARVREALRLRQPRAA